MKVDVPVQVLAHVFAYIIPNRAGSGHCTGEAGTLNAAHALLGFRRLCRRPLGRLRGLCCSRFLGLWGDNRALGERDRERGLKVGKRKSKGLIRTSPSAGSSATFFLVVFLVVAAMVGMVWRVELRVARVDAVTESVSSPSPRFLLGDTQYGTYSDHGSIPWRP